MRFFISGMLLLFATVGLAQPVAYKDIAYIGQKFDDNFRHQLDIYVPEGSIDTKRKVAIFIHGGKWKTGSKNIFRFFSRKLARHGVVGVVINYRLWPEASSYETMATDVAHAIEWIYENIEEYGGDREQLYLYGHSAGGHLAALLSLSGYYSETVGKPNPVKGCVLLDAFGLDIERYLASAPKRDRWMYDIFTKNPEEWKKAAPINYIHPDAPPFRIYVGGNTEFKIKKDTKLFYDRMILYKPDTEVKMLYKVGHLTIMFQLYNRRLPLYKEFINFMDGTPIR
jgi:acetyl esterase/lipase